MSTVLSLRSTGGEERENDTRESRESWTDAKFVSVVQFSCYYPVLVLYSVVLCCFVCCLGSISLGQLFQVVLITKVIKQLHVSKPFFLLSCKSLFKHQFLLILPSCHLPDHQIWPTIRDKFYAVFIFTNLAMPNFSQKQTRCRF